MPPKNSRRPRSAARARAAATARRTRRRATPARERPQNSLIATLESHPLIAIGVVLGAGVLIAGAITRPDPRRIATMASPLLAEASRRWSHDLAPTARYVRDEAQARLADAAASIPPRRWWEDQIDQLREQVASATPPQGWWEKEFGKIRDLVSSRLRWN